MFAAALGDVVKVLPLLVGVGSVALTAKLWADYRRPAAVPPGTSAAPLAWTGVDNVPVLGQLNRLKWIITDPVGLVWRSMPHGAVFTIRIPTFGDLTYVLFDDAYRMVMSLPADHAAIGPVLANVPTVGFWFPRTGDDHDSLQELVLTGRRTMAELLPAARVAELPDDAATIVKAVAGKWDSTVDLAQVVPYLVYELVGRYFCGPQQWARLGPRVAPLFRDIAGGVDVVRAMLATTPYHYGMREYRATRQLQAALAAHPDTTSPCGAAVAALGLDPLDAEWMRMYVLWNATAYPGSYTFWTLYDILTRPQLLARIRALPTAAQRRELLGRCLLETLRLYPVSSLIRELRKPLEFTYGTTTYHLPAHTLVGVFPAGINRSLGTDYDPDRHPGTKFAGFGRGVYGCIAADFSKTVTAAVLEELLQHYDFHLTGPAPARLVRVHQTYPSAPVPATVSPR